MFARGTFRAEQNTQVSVTRYLLHSDSLLHTPTYRLLSGLSVIVSFRLYVSHACLDVEFRQEVHQATLLHALESLGGQFLILPRGVDLANSKRIRGDNLVNITVAIDKLRLTEIDILRYFSCHGPLSHIDFIPSSEGDFGSVRLEYQVHSLSTLSLTANLDIYPQLELTRLESAATDQATIWMLSRTRSRSTIRGSFEKRQESGKGQSGTRVRQALRLLAKCAEGEIIARKDKQHRDTGPRRKVGSYSVQEHDGIDHREYPLMGFYACEESESLLGLDDSFLSSSQKSVGYSIEEYTRTEEDCSESTQFRLEKGHSSVPMITYCWAEGDFHGCSNTSERVGSTVQDSSLLAPLKQAYLQPTISYYAFPTENIALGKQL